MNYTLLEAETERLIVLAQHITGVIAFLFNIVVLTLIFMDVDGRSKGFRKYLCAMVICSLVLDTFSDIYAPIVLFNQGLVYSDSLLSHFISAAVFFALFLTLLCEFLATYFACVYYRWSVIMSQDRRWKLHGWRRIVLYLFVQAYIAAFLVVSLYFYRKAMKLLPPELDWVKSRITFAFTVNDHNVDFANYVGNPAAAVLVVAIFTMLRQLVAEVKRGMSEARAATRRYQLMAVRSLLLQGVVTSLLYVIPTTIITCFELNYCNRNARFATILSPILWIIITKHTFANSLTILYCTPSYRSKLAALLLSKIRCFIFPKLTEEREFQLKTTTTRQ